MSHPTTAMRLTITRVRGMGVAGVRVVWHAEPRWLIRDRMHADPHRRPSPVPTVPLRARSRAILPCHTAVIPQRRGRCRTAVADMISVVRPSYREAPRTPGRSTAHPASHAVPQATHPSPAVQQGQRRN